MQPKGRVFTSADYLHVSVQHNEDLPLDARSSARLTTTVINNSGMDLAVKTRLAPTLYLDANKHPKHSDYVTISTSWCMAGTAFERAMQDLERGDAAEFVTDQILRSIDARWPNSRHEKKDRQSSGYLNIDIRIQDIIDNGGSAYIQDLDLTICIDERAQWSTTHPADRTLRIKREMEAILPYIGKDTFVFGIKAVDNNHNRMHADRFMLLGEHVQKIPIECDSNLDTGVHVLMRPPATAEPGVDYLHNMNHLVYSFEEADKLFGLADTMDKVLHGGDVAVMFKTKLAERAHERTLLELERKEELNAAEIELSKQRAREAHLRANEEKSREEVKGFGDWVRAITGALTAVVALTGIFMKLKPA